MSKACSRLSIWQGPAMSASGRSLPKRTGPTLTIPFGSGMGALHEREHGAEARRGRHDDLVVMADRSRPGIAEGTFEIGDAEFDRGEAQAAAGGRRLKAKARAETGGGEDMQ